MARRPKTSFFDASPSPRSTPEPEKPQIEQKPVESSVMSIPGLGQAVPDAVSAALARPATPVVHDINANSEWRFEVPFGKSIDVKVLSGTAEIFGTELAVKHTYTFRGTKSAIHTWHGCQIEVTGACEEYIAEETPMTQYVNTHFALELLRDQAKQNGKEGPRVLVIGPNHSGKTSLVKLLTAYATRMGRQPMVINTDSTDGLLSIPGSLTATPFASMIDVEQGWGSSPTSTSSPVPVKLPLCYYYGLASPEDNTKLFKPIISRLALATQGRMEKDAAVKETGMIIDTPGVISQGKGNFDLIMHIISEFSVGFVLVLGSERLYSEISKRLSNYKMLNGDEVSVVKLDKSGGCVDRDDEFMQKTREASVREYFFGTPRSTLSPHTLQMFFDEVTIYKIREEHAPSFMPGDTEVEHSDGPLYESVEPSGQMLNSILAVKFAVLTDSMDTIRDAAVMGFVYVADVDEKKSRIRVLAPMNTRVADRPMIWGSWPETTVSLIG